MRSAATGLTRKPTLNQPQAKAGPKDSAVRAKRGPGERLTREERKLLKERIAECVVPCYGNTWALSQRLGVSYGTISRLLSDDPVLQAKCQEAEAEVRDRIKHRVMDTGNGELVLPANQITPMIFAAKAISGLSDRQTVEHRGSIAWEGSPAAEPRAKRERVALTVISGAGAGRGEPPDTTPGDGDPEDSPPGNSGDGEGS